MVNPDKNSIIAKEARLSHKAKYFKHSESELAYTIKRIKAVVGANDRTTEPMATKL